MSETISLGKRRVKTEKGAYLDYNKIAFRTALSIVRHKEDAEDIAQVTTMRYMLNEGNINPNAARSWIAQTAKNESYLVLGQASRKKEVQVDSFDVVEQRITDFLIDDVSREIEKERSLDLLNTIRAKFNSQERALLEKYLFDGQKLREYYPTKGLKLKKKSLTQKMYRLRKAIRAEYAKSQGIKTSKDLLDYRLNENLNRFIKKYQECLEKRSFESMSRYFKEIGIPTEVPLINIKKIIDQDVELIGPRQYKIYVYFIDNRKAISNFTVTFEVNESGNLVIKKVPNTKLMSSRYVIDESDVPPELLDKIEVLDEEGFIKLSGEKYLKELKMLPTKSVQARKITPKRSIRVNN
ncbi:MAG: hypothetical protein WCX83_04525 [Candidatus Cloacimonas sp.]|nr:hypothetical protein [Candidatus Cloacimonadota bacterium]